MEVQFVRWPSQRHARNELVERAAPRLLLVEAGAEPPPAPDCLEDWIRLPASDADVERRAEALRFRALTHSDTALQLDSDGVLRHGVRSVALSPLEARLAAALLERRGSVVGRHTLARAGWPGETRDRNALDVRMLRLRRKFALVGFDVTTVRSRGYMLEPRVAPTGCDQETVADPSPAPNGADTEPP